ncbi:MAG: hypothetical protein M5U34_06540 [Chloroflexi bacterium]|nr:hypothetical protein [Chloroflexota bacterium]
MTISLMVTAVGPCAANNRRVTARMCRRLATASLRSAWLSGSVTLFRG